jgi:hypothetical protein
MPASLVSEVAGAALRIVLEIIIEVVLHGTGRVILSPFRTRRFSDTAYASAGFAFWLLVAIVAGVWFWNQLT